MAKGRFARGRQARGRRPRIRAVLLGFALSAAALAPARPAGAQSLESRLEGDFGGFLRVLTDLATQIGSKSRGEMLSFLNRIELFNVESEIDRLVGSPWELSDSTRYKLSLAPLHLAYPVFDQQVRQMTRLDDIRSRRIQNLTVDSLGLIAVDLDILGGDHTGGQLASAIVRYFNAREFLDLGVFLLAQQPFFPETPEEWARRRHQIAQHEGMLALTAVGLGAMFEAGALSNSGTLGRCQGERCRLGWYGGFSRLGYHLQPTLRGGLTAHLPWLELSAGLLEQVRPGPDSASSVFEAAVRESWLGRQMGAAGWDSFVEAAARRVLAAEPGYHGESFTARGGVFLKRERPFRLRHIVLRGSTEVESDLTGSLRYALGFGVDYTRTGLSAVVQSSRTNPSGEGEPETRTALFVAGTVESPEQYFVEAMQVRARLLREAWNHLVVAEADRRRLDAELAVLATSPARESRFAVLAEALRLASAESETHRARVATLLGDYLESRRLVYSLKEWKRSPDDRHGPLDGDVLEAAAQAVFGRMVELAGFLRGSEGTLAELRRRYTSTVEDEAGVPSDRRKAAESVAEVDRAWRDASASVTQALLLFDHYLVGVRRIAGLATRLLPVRDFDPLDVRTRRRLLTLVAQPLH